MAYETVPITPGSGKDVAVDTVGGAEIQVIKLDAGGDGLSVPVVAGQTTKANSLPVTLASDQGAIPVTDNSGTLSVDDGGGSLTVDGTVAVSGSVAVTGPLTDTQLRATAVPVSLASVPSHAVTNAGTFAVQESGAALTALQLLDNCIAGNEAQVDIVASLPAGTNAIGKLAANSGVDIGDVDVTSMPTGASAAQVQGTVAHDAAAANNPVRVGGYAANVIPAAVANADAANIITDLHGRVLVVPYAPPEKWQKYTSPSDITDTADDAAFAAVASVKHYITHFSAMNAHATVGTWVYLKDGSTVIASIYCAAAGGGAVLTFDPPLAGTANTAVNVANATTGSATRVNVVGYQAP